MGRLAKPVALSTVLLLSPLHRICRSLPASLSHTSTSTALHCSGQALCPTIPPVPPPPPDILVTRGHSTPSSGFKQPPSLGDICHRMGTPRRPGPRVPTLAHKRTGLWSGWEGNGRCQDPTPQAQPSPADSQRGLTRTLGSLQSTFPLRDKPFSRGREPGRLHRVDARPDTKQALVRDCPSCRPRGPGARSSPRGSQETSEGRR